MSYQNVSFFIKMRASFLLSPKDLRKETNSTVIKRVTKFRCWAFVCFFQFLFYKMTKIRWWEVSKRNFLFTAAADRCESRKLCPFVLFLSLLSPSYITRGRLGASKAALVLMKNSHFDRTLQYSIIISPSYSIGLFYWLAKKE